MAEEKKKNEFEIYSSYISALAKMAADQASRLSDLAQAAAPGKTDYSIGDFLLAYMQSSGKLIESYLKSASRAVSK